jgi:hypothetical protein
MLCYTSALEAEGIHTFVTGNHYGSATQEIIAIGGYLVRIPAAQLDHAVALTAELRLDTQPLLPAKSLRRRIWMLVAFLAVVGGLQSFVYLRASEIRTDWYYAVVGILNVAKYPFPMIGAGNYRTKTGRWIQIR